MSFCVTLGLWSGFFIGLITEYYTSHSYQPVQETAESYQQSASTGLILGYALGFKSTFVPILLIGFTLCLCQELCGFFGIAMAAIGMLSTLVISLTIDAYGPIADNAGGIAEMSGLSEEVFIFFVRIHLLCVLLYGKLSYSVSNPSSHGTLLFVCSRSP